MPFLAPGCLIADLSTPASAGPDAPSAPGLDPLAGCRILVGVSGSIAAVKVPLLVSSLVKRGAEVRCVVTESAARLVSPVALACLSRHPCYLDADQWSHHASRPLHVALAEWADLVLVAPLSATSLARWCHGMADNLLASVLLACEAPVVAAAAMNTAMWASAGAVRNWEQLQAMPGVVPLDPGRGLLACDRRGDGRMAEPRELELALESVRLRGCQRDWDGLRLLVSAGPTLEPLDPARCLTNRSTGLMGVLLAQAARLRGATVDLVHGPLRVSPDLLGGLRLHPVETAEEMQAALMQLQPQVQAIAMAAAVADHRRQTPCSEKLGKQDLEAFLATGWQAVPDLLAGLVERRRHERSAGASASTWAGQVILGFAAQSGEALAAGQAKWKRKGCDLLFVNPIDQPGSGFASERNQGWLLGVGPEPRRIDEAGKLAIAHQLLDALLALRPPESGSDRRCPVATDP